MLRDDQMIESAHIHQGQAVLQTLRNTQIGLTGFGDPAWVIVGKDGRGRVVLQGHLDHLARMHARSVDGAPEQLLEFDHPVAVVEPEYGEDLVLQMAEPELQELLCRLR